MSGSDRGVNSRNGGGWIPDWLSTEDPDWLRLVGWSQVLFLTLGCVSIIGWQLDFMESGHELDRSHADRPARRGIYPQRIQKFFYFFYYTGVFPVSMDGAHTQLVEDPEAAHALLHDNPKLVNEDYAVIRTGDLGKIFLLYPDVWRIGTVRHATVMTFNRFLAVTSLLAVFLALSSLRRRLLAVLIVALFGSNAFALVYYYTGFNVWSYPFGVALLMLALNAPLLFARHLSRAVYLLPVVSGVFLACTREVRTEPALIAASVAALCVTASGGWRRRLLLIGLLAASYLVTAQVWSRYWDHQFEEAQRVVSKAGGFPLKGLRNSHHSVWHPIWCGLGDFGHRRGFRWSDHRAYRYAIPIVNQRYGKNYELRHYKDHQFTLLDFADAKMHYRVKPETIPEYNLVLRDKVLSEITGDPVWYLEILRKRARRILRYTTPVRLGLGSAYVDVPFTAWLFLPVLGLAAASRRAAEVKLLLFFLPLSFVPLLVYSARGATNLSAFHHVTFAVLACWAIGGFTRWIAGVVRVDAKEASR